jgi:dienelactone hydrolase
VTALRFEPDPDRGDPFGESVVLGRTPIEGIRLPRADLLLTLEATGFAPVERIASSRIDRAQRVWGLNPQVVLEIEMRPADEVPESTVWVPAGEHALLSADAPVGATANLGPFFIDRFEVTNAEFREFIRDGGYDAPGLEAFRDRTGLPGPRDWTGQEYEQGTDRLPVSSVSWYEARAFCEWRGGDLPTLYEWEKAARAGAVRQEGFALPWGIVSVGESTALRANFSGIAPVAVDAHPFGISPFGAYAMAGNVREWTANPAGEGVIAMGGSWQDPPYVFSSIATPDPASASPGLGFRCVRREGDAGSHGAGRIDLERRSPSYTPVDEQTFRAHLDFYRYDPIEPNTEVLETVKTEDWTRLKLMYDGPEDERILAYLFLPRAATPPYQTMVLIPGLTAFFAGQLHESAEWLLGPNIRAGRAVFAPVLYGMVERPLPPGEGFPASNTVEFRNLMVQHATELRLGVDYLESRGDIDMDRLAYVGQSFGAGSRSVFAAVDDRWRAVIFVGAGIDERLHPTVPEALNVNFLPYITAPKLVVNGRLDEEHPWLTRGLPYWELLSEPKELELADDEGHIPSLEVRVPAINGFLDRQFGPVR